MIALSKDVLVYLGCQSLQLQSPVKWACLSSTGRSGQCIKGIGENSFSICFNGLILCLLFVIDSEREREREGEGGREGERGRERGGGRGGWRGGGGERERIKRVKKKSEKKEIDKSV